MIIIFGLRIVWSTIATGVFHCRRCGADRQYRRRTGRRFFTLFWIPVIPLNKVGEDVRCETCKTRYVPDVLTAPTVAATQAAIQVAVTDGVRGVVSVMLRAGDSSSAASRAKALQFATGAGVAGYNEEALTVDLARPADEWRPAIQALGAQVQPEAKEWHFAELLRIAMADGPLTEAERVTAQGLAQDLGMTQAQTVGVISLMEQAVPVE